MPHPLRLELAYSNKNPVALADLTNGLNSFADEYRRSMKRHYTRFEDDKTRLYITDIKSGSIIAHLLPLAPAAMGLIENPNHLVDFCQSLKYSYGYLMGLSVPRQLFDRRTLKNLEAIVEPVIKENGSYLEFTGPAKRDDHMTFKINSEQAKEVKHAVRRELEILKAPNTKAFDDVKLQWYQARNDRSSSAGDRAVIADLYEKPVKVMFANDVIKRRMLHEFGNPFELTYAVDVVADFSGRTPKLYRIVDVHSAA